MSCIDGFELNHFRLVMLRAFRGETSPFENRGKVSKFLVLGKINLNGFFAPLRPRLALFYIHQPWMELFKSFSILLPAALVPCL
jgi:hypothetical protein